MMGRLGRSFPVLRRAPLAARMSILLIIVVAAVQLINLALVVLVPPPTEETYSAAQFAAALKGEDAGTHFSLRRFDDGEMRPQHPALVPIRDQLAAYLGVKPEELRVEVAGAAPDAPRQDKGLLDGSVILKFASLEASSFDGQKALFQGLFKVGLRQGDGSWLVARPTGALHALWKQRALLWLLSTIVVAIPCAYLVAHKLAEPIRRFGAAAEELGRNPGAPPIDTSGPKEIAAAASAFNDMQRRLNRYVDDRVMMMGAIAHDLRTPLMRLAFRLEEAPPALAGKAREDIDEMKAMLAAVLSYVRSVQSERPRERHDLRSLVLSIADELADLGHDVSVEDGDDVVVTGDGLGLKSLFANVIGNAAKYGGSARVRLAAEAGHVTVIVDDDGPGLPADELERVFEPFYRHESSRNRATGGVGLGLATARSVAIAHGGSIRLDNRAHGGLRATVVLPLVPVVERETVDACGCSISSLLPRAGREPHTA